MSEIKVIPKNSIMQFNDFKLPRGHRGECRFCRHGIYYPASPLALPFDPPILLSPERWDCRLKIEEYAQIRWRMEAECEAGDYESIGVDYPCFLWELREITTCPLHGKYWANEDCPNCLMEEG